MYATKNFIRRRTKCGTNNILRFLLITGIFLLSINWMRGGISGKIYFNWSYDTTEDADGYNEFSINRLYFTFEKKLNDNIKIKLTGDIIKPSDENAWFSYQKYAYLQWNTGFGNLLFGMQGMNVFNVAEKTWGYRFIEKSSMDKHKFASSAGMGIGYKRTLWKNVFLHLTLTNGTGYKKAEDDKYKKLAVMLVKGEKTLSKNPGYNAGLVWTTEPYAFNASDSANTVVRYKNVLALFAGFAKDDFRLGGDFSQFSDGGSEVTEQIIAVYGNYFMTKLASLYFLYDNYDPYVGLQSDGVTSIIIGVNLVPARGLNIAPNIRYRIPESGKSELSEIILNFEFRF